MTMTLPVFLALLVSIFIVGIVYAWRISRDTDNDYREPFYFVDSGDDY